jgi:hypothetical protein
MRTELNTQAAQLKAQNYQAKASALMDALYATKLGLTRAGLNEQRARDAYLEGLISVEELEERIGYEGTFRCNLS